ncbi:MAG: WxcM-like domain-containing protein [Eubacterium sp.]|nr:WxcM-like domain-containing protein [Eubacterium sp.]
MDVRMIDFQSHDDERGCLVVAETTKEIPFDIKRLYYIYDADSKTTRGFHSHKRLQQVYIGIHGSMKVTLFDGVEKREVILDNPKQGLYIGHDVWRTISDFSPGAVLLVAASELYSEDDYIRNYDEFLASLDER